MAKPFFDAFDIGGTLARAFDALKAAPWPILLGALVMQCTEGGGGGGGGPPAPSGSDSGGSGGGYDWDPGSLVPDLGSLHLSQYAGSIGATEGLVIGLIVLAVLILMVVCGLALFALRTWIEAGYIRVQRDALRHGSATFGTLFGGADAFWRLAGFKIMAGILVLGTILLAALPGGIVVVAGVIAKLTVVWGIGIGLIVVLAVWVGFYVGLGLALGRHAVALEGLGVFAAIERTWELCRGHRLWLFVYCFVMGVVTLAGICLCCIGVVLTRALADTAFTESFLALTREDAPGDLPLAQKP